MRTPDDRARGDPAPPAPGPPPERAFRLKEKTMSKSKKRREVAAALAVLIDTFPKAFTADRALRRPIKIGIDGDIVARGAGAIQGRELRLALTRYCSSGSYLRSCKAGAERVDLDGNVAGVVSAGHA